MTDTEYNLIDTSDYDQYDEGLNDYLEGRIPADKFAATRLQLGVYTQRQEGMCMVRAKVPGGRLTPKQLRGVAEMLEQYSRQDSIHLTTRQDLQFHYVPLDETSPLQRHMGRYGIASREGCGNTVRNMTSCILSGICPREHVDVTPYLRNATQYFMRHPLTQSLPRKFKSSFSACETDCAQGLIQDLAVIATRSAEGKPGFRILAAGGLGPKPMAAIELESCIDPDDLIPVMEAVLALHDKHSDRKRRTRSRLKFLVEQFGEEEFRNRYLKELERTRAAYHPTHKVQGNWRTQTEGGPTSPGDPITPLEQHQEGLIALPVSVPHGQITGVQLLALAELMEDEGLDEIRNTQDQNMLLPNVPFERVELIERKLDALGLAQPHGSDRVVACPGTATCPLGITASQRVAGLVIGAGDLRVRLNGCKNGCANSTVADIGLFGQAKRHHGRMIPSYTLELAGEGSANGKLAITGPDIPAVRVPAAVRRIVDAYNSQRGADEPFFSWCRGKGEGFFHGLLHDLTSVHPAEMTFITRDHGDSQVFAVQSVGIGECAGVETHPVDKLLLDAAYEKNLRNAFAAKNKYTDAAECMANMLHKAGHALLLAAGCDDGSEDPLVLEKLPKTLPVENELWEPLLALITESEEFSSGCDELAYAPLAEKVDELVESVRRHSRRLQAEAGRKAMEEEAAAAG